MLDVHAWTWRHGNEPTDLILETHAISEELAPNEILIANKVIGINPVDWKFIAQAEKVWKPGHIPGVDGMGVVIAAGRDVHLRIGTRVAYHQNLYHAGSYATHIKIAAHMVMPVPDDLSDTAAAAFPCPTLTAWQSVMKVPDATNKDVLVTGAGGSVGSLVAQLALQKGWRVWVTAGEQHRGKLLSRGVTEVVDYHQENWRDLLLEKLQGRKFYAAFDTISGQHAASLAGLLGLNGHLVCIQDRIEQPPLPAFTTAISYHEEALASIHQHGTVLDWMELTTAGAELMDQIKNNRLAIPTLEVVPFEQLPNALKDLKAAVRTRKYVVQVD